MKKTISGIRGIFGEDLNLKEIIEFTNNFSSLIESGRCVIGKDTRPSGQMVKDVASAALMKNGIDVSIKAKDSAEEKAALNAVLIILHSLHL